MNDPTVRPEASCIAQMGGPAFVVSTAEITLVPLTDEALGISGVVPEGWVEFVSGAYGPSQLPTVQITQRALPGVRASQLLDLLSPQLGLSQAPSSSGSREANGLTWMLFEFEVQGQPLASREGRVPAGRAT